ncbi:MAG: hypothetical protein M1835_008005 [Candelina submexicana]|nr:MAG: hypothetical protein M1835_008005 [Candelina submexicana]
MQYSTIALSLLVAAVQARTDLAGCTSTASGASLIYYVPGTGELCQLIDCGGGRAPPKTTVPGCPLYAGTASVTPNFLPGYGPNGQSATTTAASTSTSAAAAQGSLSTTTTVKVIVTSSTASASTSVITSSKIVGYGNGTTTASNTVASTGGSRTTTSGLSRFTGAANALGSTKEAVGLAFGLVAGLAML